MHNRHITVIFYRFSLNLCDSKDDNGKTRNFFWMFGNNFMPSINKIIMQ